MKKIFTYIITLLLTGSTIGVYAQDLPNSFNYQAVINAEDGSPVSNKELTTEVSILQGSDCEENPSGCTLLWKELHFPKTNDFGLFSLEIGASTAINTREGTAAAYTDINWLDVSGGYYYLYVRADFGESEKGNQLNNLGISKFSAVPYALVALKTDLAERAKALVKDAGNKIPYSLNELSGIELTSPAANQVLIFDGTKWKNASLNLSDLADVSLSSLQDGQALVYSATDSKWKNATVQSGTTPTDVYIKNAKDVSLGSILNNGDVLTYNTTSSLWENKQPAKVTKLSELTGDVVLTTPLSGQFLTYNGTNWINKTNVATCLWTEESGSGIYSTSAVAIGSKFTSSDLTKTTFITGSKVQVGNGTAEGDQSFAMYNGKAYGNGTFSVGYGCVSGVSGNTNYRGIFSFGKTAVAQGSYSIAFGNNTSVIANNSYAFGCGLSLDANMAQCFTAGRANTVVANAIFVVGNGVVSEDASGNVTATSRSNALEIYSDKINLLTDTYLKGTLLTSSDERLKTDVNVIDDALDKILKLHGITYKWDKSLDFNKNASDKTQYGVLAQEIEKVMPDLVSEGNGGYKVVNYIGIIPVLIEAVKSQQQEIDSLKSENQQLQSNYEDLLKRIEALENK